MINRLHKGTWRVYFVWIVLILMLIALVSRLIFLQLAGNERGRLFLQKQGEMRVIRNEAIPASRGEIVDRNGELLAYSTPVKSIWVNPTVFGQQDGDILSLANALDMTPVQLRQRMGVNEHYVFLRRQMNPDLADDVLALGLPGVHAKIEYKRYYPAAEFASHTVGFTDVHDKGQEGIELAFNDLLKGQEGSRQVMRNAIGETIKNIRLVEAAQPGGQIKLSIDMSLQYIAYRELKSIVQEHGARSGSMVVLDVNTGEVLALVNQPSYNVNDRSQLLPIATRNRALIDVYEPGSTVKPFTIAAALETGKVKPSTAINTSPGYIRLGAKTIVDPKDYGVLDVANVLIKSSQVGTTKLALDIGAENLRDMFSRVGFGEYCATGFPGEQVGLLPHHRKWLPIQQAVLSFGHGMTVNTMQLARAYSVLAADGIKQPVSLLKRENNKRSSSGSNNFFAANDIGVERVMAASLAKRLRAMMVGVVDEGTGKAARIPGYSVAGKTGTAHKVGVSGYEDSRYRATFAGIVPANNPQLVAVVTVDDLQGEKYFGGEVAAPVFAKVMQSAVHLLNISPDRPHELDKNYASENREIAIDSVQATAAEVVVMDKAA